MKRNPKHLKIFKISSWQPNVSHSNRSAVLYSDIVDPIFQEGVTSDGTNLTVVIERFRFEIQHSILVDASISKGIIG